MDQRSPAEKFIDIIGIINNKLEPDLANVWSDVCKCDVTNACFYKSSISYLEKDMKRLQKEFSYNKNLNLDPEVNMPASLKSNEHSKFCEQN